MLSKLSKNATRRFVHERIRKKVHGTAERPRLNVYRSVNHIYVQLIDDLAGHDPALGQFCGWQKGPAQGRREPRCGER